MKIAISTDGDLVSFHFGRCSKFTLVEIEGGKILKIEKIPNPGHQPGFLPQFLFERGVKCIICGGMGRKAQNLFSEKGIKTLVGVTGKVEKIIEKFASGELKGGDSLCRAGLGKKCEAKNSGCDQFPEK